MADEAGRPPPGGELEEVAAHLAPEFEVIRLLGRGSVASVYLARENALRRLVAVKVLIPKLAARETARRRFDREARSAARIRHPHVTAVHRVGSLPDGTPYLVMEYVEGRTLADVLEAEGPLAEETARETLRQVASALAAAHESRIVHRDVRPSNILRDDRTGRVVLSDFGLARILETGSETVTRITAAGELLGDPSHSSPEQLQGGPVTEESDVYSLGVLAYELLTGAGPYAASGRLQLALQHLQGTPHPLRALMPGIDLETADLVERCLAKKPEHRPRAAEVARTLERLRGPDRGSSYPLAGGHDTTLRRFLAELRRRKVYQVGAAYGAGLLIVFAVADDVIPNLPLPAWTQPVLIAVALGGYPVALVLAWMYDITGAGIRRTTGEEAASTGSPWRMRLLQGAGLAGSLAAAVLLAWWILG